MKKNVDNTNSTCQTILSLATGMRGLERGIERTGIELNVAAYVEIEAFAIANLVAAMEKGKLGAAPIWSDIKTFPSKEFHNKVHGVIAGYPCQPFSHAGKRKGKEDPRHLWPNIRRIVESVRPIWCFFENVEGHLTMGYDEVYRSLRDLGYAVEAGIFSAVEMGAPHQRKRLFILACTDAIGLWQGLAYANSQCRCISDKSRDGNETPSTSEGGEILEYADGASITNCTVGNETSQSNFGSSGLVSDTNCIRSRKGCKRGKTKQLNENGTQWPAPPYLQQSEFEAPRTTQPSLGGAVNGNKHRVDLLRMLGNGVVEQTAEKAFLILLDKFKYKCSTK